MLTQVTAQAGGYILYVVQGSFTLADIDFIISHLLLSQRDRSDGVIDARQAVVGDEVAARLLLAANVGGHARHPDFVLLVEEETVWNARFAELNGGLSPPRLRAFADYGQAVAWMRGSSRR